jgi:hypothetical protein
MRAKWLQTSFTSTALTTSMNCAAFGSCLNRNRVRNSRRTRCCCSNSSDDRIIGLTIEARREQCMKITTHCAGIFNAFELAYVWASARDLLTRRAVMLDHETFVYPVAITGEQSRTLLRDLLERTDSLETRARYYNTLFSNCTNELAKAAGFDWAPAFIFTGRSDEYLFRSRPHSRRKLRSRSCALGRH